MSRTFALEVEASGALAHVLHGVTPTSAPCPPTSAPLARCRYVLAVVVMFNLVIAHVLDGFFDGSHALAQGGVATQDEEEGGQEDPLRAPINPLPPPQVIASADANTALEETQPLEAMSLRQPVSETADAVPPMAPPVEEEEQEEASALVADAGDPEGDDERPPTLATSSA